jgi:hypothetical protein
MKKHFYILSLFTVLSLAFPACKPDQDIDPELGSAPTAEMATFDAQPKADNPNIIALKNTSPGFNVTWDFGNGETAQGNAVEAKYPLQGEYTITMTMYTKGGSAASSKKVTIANTNYVMLNRPDYNLLTGGSQQIGGKTWVIDKDFAGHMGLGSVERYMIDWWWQAGPNEKEGMGLYDDEYTFLLTGLGFEIKNNGDAFANGASSGDIGGTGSGDQKVSYTAPTGATWSIAEDGDKKYLILSKGAFIGFYTGVSKYEIITLEANELYLRFLDAKNPGNAWYQRLVPKGYTRPKPEVPYKIENISDDFDAAGNITWKTDGGTVFNENYDNPATFGINTTAKVAKYVKGDGQANEFNNVQINLAYKMDLTQRHKFKLMVYMPGYNDYVTQASEDWATTKRLTKQVALKLQNSESATPWETQVEKIVPVTVTDQWVELEFNFSEAANRKDLDRIVLQIGGEAHFIGGTFFVDNFRLLP